MPRIGATSAGRFEILEAVAQSATATSPVGLFSGTISTLPTGRLLQTWRPNHRRMAAALASALEAAETAAIMTPDTEQRSRAKHPHLLAKPTGEATCRFDEDR